MSTRKLYIKQKVLTLLGQDKFSVKDQNENDVLYIKGKEFSLHHTIEVFDLQGNVVAEVKKEHLTILPTFAIHVHGSKYATIAKKFSLGRDKYDITLQSDALNVSGSFFDHNFSVKRGSAAVAEVKKARISWGDSYEICFGEASQELELLLVGLVLALDTVDEEH